MLQDGQPPGGDKTSLCQPFPITRFDDFYFHSFSVTQINVTLTLYCICKAYESFSYLILLCGVVFNFCYLLGNSSIDIYVLLALLCEISECREVRPFALYFPVTMKYQACLKSDAISYYTRGREM